MAKPAGCGPIRRKLTSDLSTVFFYFPTYQRTMTDTSDHLRSITDTALIQFGAHARAIERVALRLPDTSDRAELMWLAASLRDQEQLMRDRITTLDGKSR